MLKQTIRVIFVVALASTATVAIAQEAPRGEGERDVRKPGVPGEPRHLRAERKEDPGVRYNGPHRRFDRYGEYRHFHQPRSFDNYSPRGGSDAPRGARRYVNDRREGDHREYGRARQPRLEGQRREFKPREFRRAPRAPQRYEDRDQVRRRDFARPEWSPRPRRDRDPSSQNPLRRPSPPEYREREVDREHFRGPFSRPEDRQRADRPGQRGERRPDANPERPEPPRGDRPDHSPRSPYFQ
jgi:hypothetical protein